MKVNKGTLVRELSSNSKGAQSWRMEWVEGYAHLKVRVRQDSREVQFGQERVETDQIKCHESSAWDSPLQGTPSWEHPWISLLCLTQ
jgi:hypothetical protein